MVARNSTAALTADLPSYIHDRNAQAIAAGLWIERQTLRANKLTTWYRGPKAAWLASPFIPDPAKFTFPRKSPSTHLRCFSPDSRLFRIKAKGDDDYRGPIIDEELPSWVQ